MSHHLSLLDFVLQQPPPDGGGGGGFVPDSGPKELPGNLGTFFNTIVGWTKALAIAIGFVMMLACAIMIMVGRRQRNALATEGVAGLAWIIGGFGVLASAAGIVSAFV